MQQSYEKPMNYASFLATFFNFFSFFFSREKKGEADKNETAKDDQAAKQGCCSGDPAAKPGCCSGDPAATQRRKERGHQQSR